ncbi:MAG: hypothetical protein KBG68_05160 [Prevotella sp.]|nr:hypothetical protein [Prevotella sp.]
MLLSDTINPSHMIYYRGAHVLKMLQQEGNMSIGKLYARMNETEKMTYPVLMLCLDWLYLINAAKLSEKGDVTLCI